MHKIKFNIKKNFSGEKEEVEGIYLTTYSLNNKGKDDDQVTVVYYNGNVYWLSGRKVVKTIKIV